MIKRDGSLMLEVLCGIIFLVMGLVEPAERREFVSNGFHFYYSMAAVFMINAVAIAIKRRIWRVKKKESILAGVIFGVFWVLTLLWELMILKTDQYIVFVIDIILATIGFIDAIFSFKKNRDFAS